MIRVVFDVAELAPGMGKSMGIYNYARGLLTHLALLLPEGWELHVTCNAGGARDFSPDHPRVVQHVVLNEAQPGTLARQRWMRFGAQSFVRRLGAQIYFTPKGFLPGFWGRSHGVTTVAVLHDLIPLWYAQHHPSQFSLMERVLVNGGLVRTAKWADQLIVISKATAEHVKSVTDRVAESMRIVHNGVPVLSARDHSPLSEPYLFAMASSLPHKNLAGILAAYRCYRALSERPLPMVVCGVPDPAEEGVRVVSGLDGPTLHSYYAHAEAFLFLPFIEGFGFPPLEAQAHGTPVVCSDIPALREVTQGKALLVPPSDADAAARALISAIAASKHRHSRGGGSATGTPGYSWEQCAAGVMAVLKRAAESLQ